MKKKEKVELMTVRELIDHLKQFPEDMMVLTSGYESGFEKIRLPEKVKVKHIPGNKYYEGEYQDVEETDTDVIEAVILQRNLRSD